MSSIRKAWPGLLVAMTGVGAAWLGFKTEWYVAAAPLLIVFVAGIAFDRVGKAMLASAPRRGLALMEARVLCVFALAVGAAAAALALAVAFEPGKDASDETKKLSSAGLAALTGFLTAAFVKSSETAAEDWLGKPIRAAFQATFKDRLKDKPGSDAAKAIFDDAWKGKGWATRDERRARVDALVAGL